MEVLTTQTTFQNSFESESDLEEFKNSGSVYWVLLPDSAQIVPTPNREERTGSNSVKFTLKESDWEVTNRSEIGLQSVPADSEYVYSFSTFLPESYVADPSHEIIAQWHAKPDFHLGETWHGAGPVLSLNIADGKWLLDSRWDSRQIMETREPEGSEGIELDNYQTGQWTDWVFRVKWSLEDDGSIEVWQDGELVWSRTGPNRYNDFLGPYFRMGVYKPAGWEEAQVTQREVYYDDLAVFSVEGEDPFLSGGVEDNVYILDALTAPASQIKDEGGRDTLIFRDLSVELVDLQRENNDLLLDINHDGVFDSVNDLTISGFFPSLGEGDGLIEKLGNLDGNKILERFGSDQTTFQNSFESESDLEEFKNSGSVYWVLLPDSAQIVPTPNREERTGSNSVKFTLKESDWEVTNRSEIGLQSVPADSEYVYSFSTFLPESYVADPSHEIIAQWHAKPDFHLGETWHGAGPVLSLNIADGKWLLDSRWDSRQIMETREPEGSEGIELDNYQTGQWTDWVFRVKWSLEDDGSIEVWQDGELVWSRTGPNRYNDFLGPYFRMGVYKPAGWEEAQVTQREVYYDDLAVFSVEGEDPFLSGGVEDNVYILDALTAPASQIKDEGGRDTLIFRDLSVELVDLQRENNDLLLDINHDGVFDSVNDLTISGFFPSLGEGDGLIEKLGNLDGNKILESFGSEAVMPVPIESGFVN